MLSDAESNKGELSQPAKKKKRVSYCLEILNFFSDFGGWQVSEKMSTASDHTVARFIWCWMTIC